MVDKKEVKKLMGFARRILNKGTYKKLSKLDEDEKEETIKHAIKTRLNNEFEDLKDKTNKMKKQGKDMFFIETKLHSLNGKIKLFTATYHKRDFVKMKKLFNGISKEIKNV